ncbi:MAG: TRAP transporter large permease [Firmicutes bacterium]|jgi:tripartite ATP-independent transporter DctM subunit|nr:TRAP transporter large permease [Bacillota bacterium]MDH7495691.1 TRAP transporter large permease [Bacillota bacterium]
MASIIIMFVIFLVLMLVGVPVVFSLGFATLVWLVAMNPGIPVTVAAQSMMSQLLSFTLIAMPGFLFVGRMMNTTGVTDRLFRFSVAMVGRFRGGLAHANALASMLFASMSGNAVADAGGLGLVEMTMMKKAGYKADFSAGITAASSILGPIIPPSSIMILVGSIAQISVAALFYGGILPGVILGLALMGLVAFRAHFTTEGKTWPKTRIPWREAIKTIPEAIPPLLTFVIIIGAISGGVCTPTEAAVLAVWWSIILGICYKKLTWKSLWETLDDTVRAAGVFMLIMSVASFFAWIVTFEGLPQALQAMLRAVAGESQILMFLICTVVFLIIGCFIDTGSAALLVTPIVLPAVTALGVDPIHFSIVMIIALIIGAITPPFGLCLFVVANVNDLPVKDVTKEAVRYLPAMVLTVILAIVFPGLVTWLPRILLR